jgi:hypothetical protein
MAAAGTSASAPPVASGGLILGIARNLGLTDEPDWKAPEAGDVSEEERAANVAAAAAAEASAAAASAQEDANDDLCVICYDQLPTCVFLECGHGGFCRRCAHRLFVRPPGECPTCRQTIDQVRCQTIDQVRCHSIDQVRCQAIDQVRRQAIDQVRRQAIDQVRCQAIDQVRVRYFLSWRCEGKGFK